MDEEGEIELEWEQVSHLKLGDECCKGALNVERFIGRHFFAAHSTEVANWEVELWKLAKDSPPLIDLQLVKLLLFLAGNLRNFSIPRTYTKNMDGTVAS